MFIYFKELAYVIMEAPKSTGWAGSPGTQGRANVTIEAKWLSTGKFHSCLEENQSFLN